MQSFILLSPFDNGMNNGYRLRLNTDLMMDIPEKTRDAIGMDGRQAILPRSSSTQKKEREFPIGIVRMPLSMSQTRIMTWMGDSTAPVMDLTS